EDAEVEIAFLDNQVQFSFQNVQVISRLIEGVFPPYQNIIPKSFSVTAIIPKNDLAKAVKTASLFSRTGVFDVVIECKEGSIVISALNMQLGQSKTTIDASVTGSGTIVLNHKYLLDGLNSIDSTSVVFTMNNENSPCLLRAAETLDGAQSIEKQDYLYIIMPIKQ
ncbi:hypothetical protein IT409_01065, partial [Candidatus Falkowbacteria bacterium]|nr:hypothetical protein [Candidatus Falkowbacteria bacterium]